MFILSSEFTFTPKFKWNLEFYESLSFVDDKGFDGFAPQRTSAFRTNKSSPEDLASFGPHSKTEKSKNNFKK